MIRSLLFVPGDNPRMLAKSFDTAADALIFDLEDAVKADRKEQAREITSAAIASRTTDKLLFVRVNAYDTGLTLADLCAVMPKAPAGIVLPKCSGADQLARLDHQLEALETAYGIETGSTLILPIVTETAASIFSLGSYANVTPRLWGMVWGAEDLSSDLAAAGPRLGTAFTGPASLARNLTLFAARAARVHPVDAVYTRIDDLAGLEEEARIAQHEGFAGKAVIHPSHLETVNRAFMPTAQQIERARKIVAAIEQAPTAGAIRVDGELVEKPHYRAAKALLARAGGD